MGTTMSHSDGWTDMMKLIVAFHKFGDVRAYPYRKLKLGCAANSQSLYWLNSAPFLGQGYWLLSAYIKISIPYIYILMYLCFWIDHCIWFHPFADDSELPLCRFLKTSNMYIWVNFVRVYMCCALTGEFMGQSAWFIKTHWLWTSWGT